jgi:hypothetical protein
MQILANHLMRLRSQVVITVIRRLERRLDLEFSWNCDFPFAYKSEDIHVMAKILMPKYCARNLTDSLIAGQRQNDCIAKKTFINALVRHYP